MTPIFLGLHLLNLQLVSAIRYSPADLKTIVTDQRGHDRVMPGSVSQELWRSFLCEVRSTGLVPIHKTALLNIDCVTAVESPVSAGSYEVTVAMASGRDIIVTCDTAKEAAACHADFIAEIVLRAKLTQQPR